MVSTVNSFYRQKLCRYCRQPSSAHDPLIAPCRCKGSMKFVHRTCLELVFKNRVDNDRRCQGCQMPIFVQPRQPLGRRWTGEDTEANSALIDGDVGAGDSVRRHTWAFAAIILSIVTVFLAVIPTAMVLGYMEKPATVTHRNVMFVACAGVATGCVVGWASLLYRLRSSNSTTSAGGEQRGTNFHFSLKRHICVKDLTAMEDGERTNIPTSLSSTPRHSFGDDD